MRSLVSMWVVLMLAMCAWTVNGAAPTAEPPIGETTLLETLTRLEKASWEAWQKRDGGFFATFLSSDHVEVGFGGPTNKATVVAGVASPSCVVRTYEVDHFQITAFTPEIAVLTYHAQQDTTCNGVRVPSPVWTSSLYIKRAGRWQNAVYQQTPASK